MILPELIYWSSLTRKTELLELLDEDWQNPNPKPKPQNLQVLATGFSPPLIAERYRLLCLMSALRRSPVISQLRALVRLLRCLPEEKKATSLAEARFLFRLRAGEKDNQKALDHQKELASKIAYLRIITPKQQSGPTSTGTYVLREGKLVEGSGEARGSRSVPTCQEVLRVFLGHALPCSQPPCSLFTILPVRLPALPHVPVVEWQTA